MNEAAKEWLSVNSKLVVEARLKRPYGRTIHMADLDSDIASYGNELAEALFAEIERKWPNSVTPQSLGPAGGTKYRIHFHIDLPRED